MNIWIIDHYSSEPIYGGISRQYDFAIELAKRNYNVVVVASSFSHFTHKYISEENCCFHDLNDKAHYVYLKTTEYKKNSSLKRIYNTISFEHLVKKNYKKIIDAYGTPDVVVGCSIHPFTWIAANYVAKKCYANFFAEVRDLWPQTQIEDEGMSKYHPLAIILGNLEKWAYTHADKIIYSMSRGDKYICDILGYPKEKVAWIGQPIDCERFDRNRKRYEELDEELKNFIGDSFLCVFSGYYMDYEGVNEILEAAKNIQGMNLPIKFVLVGSGSEEDKMRSYSLKNKLENVYIGKRISKELIPALLNRADICLANLAIRNRKNSYKYDASKNKLYEYLYSNSCVIYGTYVEHQFVQTSGSGFTIEPFNTKELVEKILYVYNLPENERNKFGANGMNYILNNNTVEKLVDKYILIIKEGTKND